MGKAPGFSSGNYKKHLDKVLPASSVELCTVTLPLRYGGVRVPRGVLVAPPHELMASEYEAELEPFGD
eukprot:7496891-Pyramimonas_sp.AAC.1